MNSRILTVAAMALLPSCELPNRPDNEPNVFSKEIYGMAMRKAHDKKIPREETDFFVESYTVGAYDMLVSNSELDEKHGTHPLKGFQVGSVDAQAAIRSNEKERWRLLNEFGYKNGKIRGFYSGLGRIEIGPNEIWRLRNFSGNELPLGDVVVHGLISDKHRVYSSKYQREIIAQKVITNRQ